MILKNSVACAGCGYYYDLTEPYFKEAPLECCGECGCDVFYDIIIIDNGDVWLV